MRGGIAERGGIRVGHRIIEINGQSVVATPHEKIIDILSHAVGEVRYVSIVHLQLRLSYCSHVLLCLCVCFPIKKKLNKCCIYQYKVKKYFAPLRMCAHNRVIFNSVI